MNGMVKRLLIAAGILAVAGVLVSAAFAVWRERRVKVVIPEAAALTPEVLAHPGAPAEAAVSLRLPWGDSVETASAVPGAGTVISGPVRVTSRWRWGYRLWRIAATVRPLASRGSAPGTLTVTIDRLFGAGVLPAAKIAIPAPRVEPVPAAPEEEPLRLAGAETAEREPSFFRRHWRIFAIAAALLIALALLWRRFRRRREVPEIPPWTAALAELELLRRDMAKRGFVPAEGVRRLSDILRTYLTRRFGVPADTETTEEFVGGALDDAAEFGYPDRELMREFLAAADLVTFARAPADASALVPALDRAAELVERTTPRPAADAEGKGAAS